MLRVANALRFVLGLNFKILKFIFEKKECLTQLTFSIRSIKYHGLVCEKLTEENVSLL